LTFHVEKLLESSNKSLQDLKRERFLSPHCATSSRKGEPSDRSWMARIITDTVHVGPTVCLGGTHMDS
jgi:hypothetical protein